MEVQPIVTRRVYQEIIAQFVEMIKDDRIKVGEKLPAERILAEMFHVSRPSVREALRVMETIGLIEIRAGGGAYVTELNLGPFLSMFAPLFTRRQGFELELIDLREMLELKAAALAAEYCDNEAASYLEETIIMMREALDNNDPDAGARSDIAFHTRIFEKSNNFVLQKASEFVNSLLELSIEGSRTLVLEKEEDAAQLYEDHRLIFKAIRENNPGIARERMAAHIEMVKRITKETLNQI